MSRKLCKAPVNLRVLRTTLCVVIRLMRCFHGLLKMVFNLWDYNTLFSLPTLQNLPCNPPRSPSNKSTPPLFTNHYCTECTYVSKYHLLSTYNITYYVCSQSWPLSNGQPIGKLFSGHNQLSESQLSASDYSSFSWVELLWAFLHPLWHVLQCCPCSDHFWTVILERLYKCSLFNKCETVPGTEEHANHSVLVKSHLLEKSVQPVIYQTSIIAKMFDPRSIDKCSLYLSWRRILFSTDGDYYRKSTANQNVKCWRLDLFDTSTKDGP